MRSDEIEEALRMLLGPAAGPPGIVLTLRRHDEYQLLLDRIAALEKEKRDLQIQVYQMQDYPRQLLVALDELRLARKLLQKNFIDTSFIRSLK